MPKESPFFISIGPYIVALIPLADRDYPSVVPFDRLLEDNRYRKSPPVIPHIPALSWGRAIRRSNMTTIEKNLIYGPRILDS